MLDWEIWIYILKSGFRICNRTRNPKKDFNAEKSVFGFPFYRSIGKSEKGLKLTVLKNSGLARARIISEKRPLLTRTVLQILFRISQSNGKEEIHEIRIWISKLKSTLRTDFSKVKSENEFRVRLQNPKSGVENLTPGFPIEGNLIFGWQGPRKLPLCRRGSVQRFE